MDVLGLFDFFTLFFHLSHEDYWTKGVWIASQGASSIEVEEIKKVGLLSAVASMMVYRAM